MQLTLSSDVGASDNSWCPNIGGLLYSVDFGGVGFSGTRESVYVMMDLCLIICIMWLVHIL